MTRINGEAGMRERVDEKREAAAEIASKVALTVGDTIRYWDGPIEFFGTLNGDPVFAKCVDDSVMSDDREFQYWALAQWNGDQSLPETGRFTSADVGWTE